MLRRIVRIFGLVMLLSTFLLPATVSTAHTTNKHAATSDFPAVDPDYVYNQLFYMATHFLHREAGYDTNLPATSNGHDEFAAYWSQEIVHELQGFGPQVRRDEFTISGWHNRPAHVPAFNVEVSVPGITHPEQEVVIGCHYDGEAVSTQSANDDASGCAIELGVARALGIYWQTHHVYPARTLRFVIFDAEEQGLYGSFHYVNSTILGDMHNVVAMFNEEQSGIAYPLRYLGQLANPLMPLYVEMTPLHSSNLYPNQHKLSEDQRTHITRFNTLLQQAVVAAFQQFRTLGFTELTYHAADKSDQAQPIFTSDQQSNVHLEEDIIGSSDQMPFTMAGIPCATPVGNVTYYDHQPPPGSYPYDQKYDTIQLMNTFADGSSHKSNALALALALPGMLTTWMLNQPDILGQASADSNPIAAISDIGPIQVGQAMALDARTAFDPGTNQDLTYAWDFGDSTKATGITVNHTYTSPGIYTLTLTVSTSTSSRRVSKILTVVSQPSTYPNPADGYIETGYPPTNLQAILPTPDDTLSDSIIHPSTLPSSPRKPTATTATPGILPVFYVIVVLVIALLLLAGFMRWRRSRAKGEKA